MTPVEEAAAQWGVRLHKRTQSGANDVWFAQRDDAHMVVKGGDRGARFREAWALLSFTHGSIQLLAHDHDRGVLLIDRVILGDDLHPMSATNDDRATSIIGHLISELHHEQEPAGALPQLSTLRSVFGAPPDPRLDVTLVQQAAAIFDELVNVENPVVLHGDLQHFNVLRDGFGTDGDRWVAIDPHGWIGDPVFDTAPLMANPRTLGIGSDSERCARLAERRIAVLAEVTGFDRDRIRAWAFTAAVIAELWMIEDHDLVHGAPLALAHALRERV